MSTEIDAIALIGRGLCVHLEVKRVGASLPHRIAPLIEKIAFPLLVLLHTAVHLPRHRIVIKIWG